MVLERYGVLNSYLVKAKEQQKEEKVEVVPLKLEDNSVLITLADMSPLTKDYVTAHKLSDYRRKDNSILLIPNTEAVIDKLLVNREEVRGCIPTL